MSYEFLSFADSHVIGFRCHYIAYNGVCTRGCHPVTSITHQTRQQKCQHDLKSYGYPVGWAVRYASHHAPHAYPNQASQSLAIPSHPPISPHPKKSETRHITHRQLRPPVNKIPRSRARMIGTHERDNQHVRDIIPCICQSGGSEVRPGLSALRVRYDTYGRIFVASGLPSNTS